MLRLRPYNDNDADTILSWAKDERAFYEWNAGNLGDYPISREEFSVVNDNISFTAIYDEKIVGFLIMKRFEESFDILRFCYVIVDDTKRGNGYGKQMMILALKYAKEIFGAKKVSLGVFECNVAAYNCYKSVGFKQNKPNTQYLLMGEKWECLELEIEL